MVIPSGWSLGWWIHDFLLCIQNEGEGRFIQPGVCAHGGQPQCYQGKDKKWHVRRNLSISMVISHSVEGHASFTPHT